RALLRPEAVRLPKRARAAAAVLLGIHAAVAPLLLASGIMFSARMARGTEAIEASLDLEPPLPKRVYVVSASDPLGPLYASAIRTVLSPGDLKTFEIFSMAKRTHRVTRTGPSTLHLETLTGTLFDGGFVDIFRARRLGLHTNETVTLDGATVR